MNNQVFDINQFPPSEGILLFAISMSKISGSQNATKCFEMLESLVPKIQKPLVGLNFLYGDYLYLHSDEKASSLRTKYLSLILSHKNNFINILKKNPWYIQKAVSYQTWNQTIISIKEWTYYIGELNKVYKQDKQLQRYLKKDCENMNRKVTKNQIQFILEESLLFHLIAKGKAALPNEFIQHHEKWILLCYPGKPLYTEIYLSQKNIFKLTNRKNKYEDSFYDLSEKKVFNYLTLDLQKITL